MKFTETDNCDTCKNGYFLTFDSSGFHSICGAYECYLCAQRLGECDEYEKGDVPEGKERDL